MLATLDDVKDSLGITTDTYDDFLTAQIQIISEAVEAYCRRKFELATYTQTFYGNERRSSHDMYLFAYPVKEVTSIIADGVTVSGYRVHKPSGIVRNPNDRFFGADETVVVYQAGFEEVPALVKNAVIELAGARYALKSSGVNVNFGSDVQRVSIPGAISIDFDYTLTNNDRSSTMGIILGDQVNVLDSFRSDRAILPSEKLEWVDVAT